jgi:hypothetical protein
MSRSSIVGSPNSPPTGATMRDNTPLQTLERLLSGPHVPLAREEGAAASAAAAAAARRVMSCEKTLDGYLCALLVLVCRVPEFVV